MFNIVYIQTHTYVRTHKYICTHQELFTNIQKKLIYPYLLFGVFLIDRNMTFLSVDSWICKLMDIMCWTDIYHKLLYHEYILYTNYVDETIRKWFIKSTSTIYVKICFLIGIYLYQRLIRLSFISRHVDNLFWWITAVKASKLGSHISMN